MATAGRDLADWLSDATMTVLGIVLAMVPLALWFAWSETVFYWVLGVGAAAFTVIYLLSRFGPPDQAAWVGKRIVLSEQFIAELQRLYPLTYHHRRPGEAGFRRKMERLLRLIEKSDR